MLLAYNINKSYDKSQPAINDINTCFYTNIWNDNNTSSDPSIKEEDGFYITQKKYKEKNKKLNPLIKQRKVSRCAICHSKMHWAKNL